MDKTIFRILQEVDEDIRIYEKYGKRVGDIYRFCRMR